MGNGLAGRGVWRVEAGASTPAQDTLAEEVPVAIQFDGAAFAVMMASPSDLEDLAIGFALTECRLPADAITAIEVREVIEGIVLDITTREPAASATAPEPRSIPGRSGCGLCGSRALEDVVRRPATVGEGARLAAGAIEAALSALRSRQPLNAATGALHAAAWFDTAGDLMLVREDIGRHNALDKLIGAMRRSGTSAQDGFALVTSRASYEMAAKAAEAGIPLLAAMSAPSALAVDLARDCGLTLVGFTRPGRHVVYSHPQRLDGVAHGNVER
ncbi:formate dehydrogenase accessory sulfurtransferase FdhD [Marilutibacter aestuarii]|uniref:Sulfur carrier protein FdhD n=1 Tax=Marilutibacter aestuarii TaxID=1706195 RepID=A0A508ARF8_9GAMM|nr:formate dehydrogenase accessory sulfurtransferase FdhD [Lysobacter aestuarii]TQD49705.1 formate dehydrogenase accessory sulfurtransferase FdhD [Lysobacter aestuarii]